MRSGWTKPNILPPHFGYVAISISKFAPGSSDASEGSGLGAFWALLSTERCFWNSKSTASKVPRSFWSSKSTVSNVRSFRPNAASGAPQAQCQRCLASFGAPRAQCQLCPAPSGASTSPFEITVQNHGTASLNSVPLSTATSCTVYGYIRVSTSISKYMYRIVDF